jgi:hypothetical protein
MDAIAIFPLALFRADLRSKAVPREMSTERAASNHVVYRLTHMQGQSILEKGVHEISFSSVVSLSAEEIPGGMEDEDYDSITSLLDCRLGVHELQRQRCGPDWAS